MSNFNKLHTLATYQAAILYTGLGFNVMPLKLGTKCPALSAWKHLQTRPANREVFRRWFDGTDANIAIITGPISRLLVLDFDQVDLYRHFTSSCPELARSYTVQTRRGFHIYLRVPDHLSIDLKGCPGLDIMWQGRYIVAPPSIVDGFLYHIKISGEMVEIKQSHLDRLSAFTSQFPNQSLLVHCDRINARKGAYNAKFTPTSASIKPSITEAELQALYRHDTPIKGRNNALFEVACLGRDLGMNQSQVEMALIDLHAHQQNKYDRHEPFYARQREAERTIKSAFTRPPRPHRVGQTIHDQIPNHIIEQLLRDGHANVIRTLLALRMQGRVAGTTFYAGEAVDMLEGIVGRDSVYAALNWLESVSPVPPSKMSNDIAGQLGKTQTLKCKKVSVKKPVITRPTRIFIMPSNAQLAAILGCQIGPVMDQLSLEDLQSAKSLRMAYHARFLRRRSGQYTLGLLAKRLGVTKRTVQNYNAADKDIQSSPQYDETRVFWSNLEDIIPDELPHGGFFLTDAYGKRYPAKREVARFLLGRKQRVTLWRQVANMYWYGDLPMPSIVSPAPESVPIFQRQTYSTMVAPQTTGRQKTQHNENETFALNTYVVRSVDDPEAVQRLAEQLYEQINALPREQGGKLSLKRARKMVEQYGVGQVREALKKTLQRRNVRNPAGFISTLLRSERFRTL